MTGSELFPIVAPAAKESTKPLREAVGGTLAETWHAIVGDRVVAWRLRNAATLNEKLGAELAKRGQTINLENIPERYAYSWFEKATQEDEPEIQELFAKLLSNAAEGNADALLRRNIELVSNFSPGDAKLLDYVAQAYVAHCEKSWNLKRPLSFREDQFFYNLRGLTTVDDTSVDVMLRHLILTEEVEVSIDGSEIRRIATADRGDIVSALSLASERSVKTQRRLELTSTGKSLIEALYPKELDASRQKAGIGSPRL